MKTTVSRSGKQVRFEHANDVRIPPVCVVCGREATQWIDYQQDHRPITLPGVAFLTWTDVRIPYCEIDGLEFQKRFKILRAVQSVLYIVVLVTGGMWLFTEEGMDLGITRDVATLSGICAGIGFLTLVATIFVIKPRLYDVFINHTASGLRVSCKSTEFIAAMVQQNEHQI